MSAFALISIIAVICDVFYLLKAIAYPSSSSNSIQPYAFILLAGVLFSYVNNIIFLFVARHTLLKDDQFIFWKRGNVNLIK